MENKNPLLVSKFQEISNDILKAQFEPCLLIAPLSKFQDFCGTIILNLFFTWDCLGFTSLHSPTFSQALTWGNVHEYVNTLYSFWFSWAFNLNCYSFSFGRIQLLSLLKNIYTFNLGLQCISDKWHANFFFLGVNMWWWQDNNMS
jgi:hypothetical protein